MSVFGWSSNRTSSLSHESASSSRSTSQKSSFGLFQGLPFFGDDGTKNFPRPLELEDIVVWVIPDVAETSAKEQQKDDVPLPKNHIIEESHFVVPLDTRGRPLPRTFKQKPITLSQIHICVETAPEEGLLFGTSMLSASEQELLTKWIVRTYSMTTLKIASEQILEELAKTPADAAYLLAALEQRTRILAEASVMKASDEAEDARNGCTGLKRTTKGMPKVGSLNVPAPRKPVVRVRELLEERSTIESTLRQFTEKIELFSKEDPATAEMLVPTKLDLERKLTQLRTELAALGVDFNHAYGSAPFSGDAVGTSASDRSTPHAEHEDPFSEPSSSEDEDDYRMALPIAGSEYDIPFPNVSSGGYISDSGSSSYCDRFPNDFDDRPHESEFEDAGDPDFVIDLSLSRSQIHPRLVKFDPIDMPPTTFVDTGDHLSDDVGDSDYDTLDILPSPSMKSDFARDGGGSSGSSLAGGNSSDLESPLKTSPRGRKTWVLSADTLAF